MIRVWTVWYADRHQYVLQWLDPVTGKRRSQSSGETSKRAAERLALEKEQELNSTRPQADGHMRWSDFVDEFRNGHLAGLKARSEDKADSVLSVFTKLIDPATVGVIDTQVLANYAAKLRKIGREEATIKGHLTLIRQALNYAVRAGYLDDVPASPKIARSASGRRAKGRPLTLPEFAGMLRATPGIVGDDHTPSWRHLLKGLWLSGLRLDEALNLTWDDPTRLHIILDRKFPLLGLTMDYQKNFRDQISPLTKDFCRFLLRTPKPERKGFVFRPTGSRTQRASGLNYVSKRICEIGERAGIVVDARKGKFASAHDLRRTFGERWAHQVQPATLRELMRHASIETTMTFYAVTNAERTAELLWNTTNRTTDR